ncbi:uncharacterized protein [Apostichopus japonicus]|uniref:uncharacterized protein n=1 Tax=Stichopus japonicus TaxID=307972 RepID=UPI003AB763D8
MLQELESRLSTNAIKRIFDGESQLVEPIVQFLGFCYCDLMSSGTLFSCTRRSVRLSDGENFIHAYLSGDFFAHEGNPNELQDNWIIKLKDYYRSAKYLNRRVVLVHQVEVLDDSPDVKQVGFPTSVEPKSQLKWYNPNEIDNFYANLDILCEIQEPVRGKRSPSAKAMGDFFTESKTSANQDKHFKQSKDVLEDSIEFFQKHRHNPKEVFTPYMALMSEHGRKLIAAKTIETCYEGKHLEEARYIQIVDFRLVKDRKNEEFFHVLVNDGLQMTTAILCPYHLNTNSRYRGPTGIKKFCLVKVLHYACLTVSKERKCIIFHELAGDVLNYDCVIRSMKYYPEYVSDKQNTIDPLLRNVRSFAEVMEREGISQYGCRTEKRTGALKPFKVKKTKKTTHNNLPLGESVISVGAVEKLSLGEEVKNPILQIVLFKKIIHQSTERHALLLSDGYDIMTSMIDPLLMESVPKGAFQCFTVLQILKYKYVHLLMNRKTLFLQKIGYHIPVTKETKKPIGEPMFYAFDIEHSPEVLKAMPKFTPVEVYGPEPPTEEQKSRLHAHMLLQFNKEREAKGLPPKNKMTTDKVTLSDPPPSPLPPPYGPNKRVPAVSGFCKYADRWHDKVANTTKLPDGRLVIRKPAEQRVPYKVSIDKKFHGKLVSIKR